MILNRRKTKRMCKYRASSHSHNNVKYVVMFSFSLEISTEFMFFIHESSEYEPLVRTNVNHFKKTKNSSGTTTFV